MRVQRPQFTERDWDGVFFGDLFRDGLVGARPGNLNRRPPGVASIEAAEPAVESAEAPSAAVAWSTIISAEALEDEIKRLENQLTSRTASGYQSFSELAMLMMIVAEFDAPVRWQDSALQAAGLFVRAAATPDSDLGRMAGEQLRDLVRGRGWSEPQDEISVEELALLRRPLMMRLRTSYHERLRPMTSAAAELRSNAQQVDHEASLIAAIATMLARNDMPDAEYESYQQYALELKSAALATAQATRRDDFDSAARAINRLGQSCANCHDEWGGG